MRRGSRKTTPRVKDGRVQRKNYRDVQAPRGGPLAIEVEVPGPGYRHLVTADDLRRFFALIPEWAEVSAGLHAVVLADGDAGADGYYEGGVIELNAWPDPPAETYGARYFTGHRAVFDRLGVRWRLAPAFVAAIPTTGDLNRDLERAVKRLRDHIEDDDVEIDGPADEAASEWAIHDPRDESIHADVTRIGDELHVYERCYALAFDRRTARAYQLLHVFLHELGHHIDASLPPRRGLLIRGEDYAEGWALRCADRIWGAYTAAFR